MNFDDFFNSFASSNGMNMQVTSPMKRPAAATNVLEDEDASQIDQLFDVPAEPKSEMDSLKDKGKKSLVKLKSMEKSLSAIKQTIQKTASSASVIVAVQEAKKEVPVHKRALTKLQQGKLDVQLAKGAISDFVTWVEALKPTLKAAKAFKR